MQHYWVNTRLFLWQKGWAKNPTLLFIIRLFPCFKHAWKEAFFLSDPIIKNTNDEHGKHSLVFDQLYNGWWMLGITFTCHRQDSICLQVTGQLRKVVMRNFNGNWASWYSLVLFGLKVLLVACGGSEKAEAPQKIEKKKPRKRIHWKCHTRGLKTFRIRTGAEALAKNIQSMSNGALDIKSCAGEFSPQRWKCFWYAYHVVPAEMGHAASY